MKSKTYIPSAVSFIAIAVVVSISIQPVVRRQPASLEKTYGVGPNQLHFSETLRSDGDFKVVITPNPYIGTLADQDSQKFTFFAYEAYIGIKCKGKGGYDLSSDTATKFKDRQEFSFHCLDKPPTYNGNIIFSIADTRRDSCSEDILGENPTARDMCGRY